MAESAPSGSGQAPGLGAGPSGKAPGGARLDYAAWFARPEGRFALAAQQTLLRRMVAGWPRRGRKLLEIGCGAGVFLESFWSAGFDVSGQETDQDLARQASLRLGKRADVILGSRERLPFDDQSFDYVTCINNLEFAADPEAALREAVRLASAGVLLAFPNRLSLCGLGFAGATTRAGQPVFGRYKPFTPWAIWLLARRAAPGARLTWGSALLGPASTWKPSKLGRFLNLPLFALPLGCSVMARLDFPPPFAGASLPAPLRENQAAVLDGGFSRSPFKLRSVALPAPERIITLGRASCAGKN